VSESLVAPTELLSVVTPPLESACISEDGRPELPSGRLAGSGVDETVAALTQSPAVELANDHTAAVPA
jgi:hypothetical protein